MSQENDDVAPPPATPKAAVRDGRGSLMVVSGVIAAVLAVAAIAIPVPYVIESPGPAINTIGKVDGQPVISVSGRESFPATSGTLDLTTVHLAGGLPDSQINIFEALRGWLTPSDSIYPAELIYAPGTSQDTVNSENSAAMTGSQENATAAALKVLGIGYKTVLAVASVPSDGASNGILKPDDVLLTVDGKDITGLPVIEKVLAAGKGAPVQVTVQRGGADKTVTVTPRANKDGKYLLGISLQNNFTFPFKVDITLSNIGGPSAGMMFSLGILDTLTKGEMTGGKHFAGTGTIDPNGNVGAIGGIAQKMVGARDNGADYFLAPAANCSDVVGHVPNGLHVVKVATLKEAYAAVTAVGSGADRSTLPACK